jgi:uncharacterized coiled-coil protein SlyX
MNKESILNQIRNIIKFSSSVEEQKFLDVKSGDNIIRTMSEDFTVGEGVFLVTEDGEVPAPDGSHLLDDGRTIIVSGGLLEEIKESLPAEEVAAGVEEFESELEIDEEEGKVKDEVTMKKMQEAEDKIVMLEEKIKDIEEVVTEMTKAFGETRKYSEELEGKLEKFMKSTPAEAPTNWKNEYKNSIKETKNVIEKNLEGFRSIRNK